MMSDNTEIQKIIRKQCQKLFASKLNNLGEMDKCLETYDLPRLSKKETENLNKLITTNKITQ